MEIDKSANLPVREMLEGFCTSYIAKTPNPVDISFGFLINDGQWWTVSIQKEGSYTIANCKPSKPTFYLVSTAKTLEDSYLWKMHFLTAAGRAKMNDYAPLDVRFIDGYSPPKDLDLMDFAFHFFVIGEPEKILFGKDHARVVHGGYAVPLVYTSGLRTAWYRVEQGMVINEKEDDQYNPFNTLVIGTKGEGSIKLGHTEYRFAEGEAYIIPANTAHSFWTDDEDGLEFVIIMYGEGA